jgi:transketolase
MEIQTTSMSIQEMEEIAATIRCDIIEMIAEANAGHPGGSLSAADIVTALYFRVMRVDPQDPNGPERDRMSCPKSSPDWVRMISLPGPKCWWRIIPCP